MTAPAAIVTSVLLGECDRSSTGLPAAAGIPACANVMPQRDRQCLARGAIVLFFSKGTGMPRPANDLGAIVPFVASQKVKGETFVARALLNCCGCGFSAFGHGMPCPYCRVGWGGLVWRGMRRCWCWRLGHAWRLFLRRGLRRNACRPRRWASPSRRRRGNVRSASARRPIRVRRRVRSPRRCKSEISRKEWPRAHIVSPSEMS